MPCFRAPTGRHPTLADARWCPDLETVRQLVAEALRPAHFFTGSLTALEWEHTAREEIAWEVLQGRLLDPAHTTVRQQFEAHRADPPCASCHMRMDPLGFALENYDAIGRWRTHEGKFPIDASGAMPSGKTFNGPAELKAILKSNPEIFTRALTEKLLTYALGRGLERYDRPVVDAISHHVAENHYHFSTLIMETVKSMPFEMRRGEANRQTAIKPSSGGPSS